MLDRYDRWAWKDARLVGCLGDRCFVVEVVSVVGQVARSEGRVGVSGFVS